MKLSKPLGYMLGRSLRFFKNQLVLEFRENGIELTIEHFVILQLLSWNCDLIQRDLANWLQKDKSIIVRQINSLLDNQFVVRIANKEDKRIKNLILTEKGSEILHQMMTIADKVYEKLLVGVSDTELEIFQNVLRKIQENGKTDEGPFNCGFDQPK